MGMQMKTEEIDEIIRDIGQVIRKERKTRKISADDLASSVGLGRMTINRIETGDTGVSIANVLKVAGALALDLDIKSMIEPEAMLLKLMQIRVGKTRAESGSVCDSPKSSEEHCGMGL